MADFLALATAKFTSQYETKKKANAGYVENQDTVISLLERKTGLKFTSWYYRYKNEFVILITYLVSNMNTVTCDILVDEYKDEDSNMSVFV